MSIIERSTLQLLRFHFSFFLMPVYWFAIGLVREIDKLAALEIFMVLHLLVYPASNGYNSYMDRDTDSIGGIQKPLPPTRQLFYVTVAMDLISLLAAYLVSPVFFAGILIYILASRAYSYRGIRLKKYPVAGYLVVILVQGCLTFFLVMHGSSRGFTVIPLAGLIGAGLLVGGFYPLTQIYQHEQDRKDGVTTLSFLLGLKGTFLFTAIVYVLAMSAMAYLYLARHQFNSFLTLQIFLSPVLVYFAWWFYKVSKDKLEANFKNTMRMNMIASLFTNMAFIVIFLIQQD